MLKTDWRIVKSSNPKFGGKWDVETRVFLCDAKGRVESMAQNWARHSAADSKGAALSRIMLLRERGETVSWEGRAMRLGIATLESCNVA